MAQSSTRSERKLSPIIARERNRVADTKKTIIIVPLIAPPVPVEVAFVVIAIQVRNVGIAVT